MIASILICMLSILPTAHAEPISPAREKFIVWNFVPDGQRDYRMTAEYRALAKRGDVTVIDILKKPGEGADVGLKRQLKQLCKSDAANCRADIVVTGHSSGESFWGDKNTNRLHIVEAKRIMDELAAEGIHYRPRRVFMVGCYTGAVGYMALGAKSSKDELSASTAETKPTFTAWSDLFEGQPVYYGFGLKGPERNDPIFGRYLEQVLKLSDQVSRAAEQTAERVEANRTKPVLTKNGCTDVVPLTESQLSKKEVEPLSALLAKFDFIAQRNPSICVQAGGKTLFADRSGTIIVNRQREDPRCSDYFRRAWCSPEIKQLSNTYQCFFDPLKSGCENSKFDSPPPETATNEIRKFYNQLQSSIHCEAVFENLKMEKFPIPFHVLGLIKFRSVVQGYMKELKADPDRKDLYNSLTRAGIEKMSRRQMVKFLKDGLEKDPMFSSAYYTLVTFNQVQEKWFN